MASLLIYFINSLKIFCFIGYDLFLATIFDRKLDSSINIAKKPLPSASPASAKPPEQIDYTFEPVREPDADTNASKIYTIQISIPDTGYYEEFLDVIGCLEGLEGCEEEKIQKIAQSGFSEYYNMIIGKNLYTRGDDMIEYRLFTLIENYFVDDLPSPEEVARMMHKTSAISGTMIQRVLSKFETELKARQHESASKILGNPQKIEGDNYSFVIRNKAVKDYINSEISYIGDGLLPNLVLKRNTRVVYALDKEVYEKLCQRFGIQVESPKKRHSRAE